MDPMRSKLLKKADNSPGDGDYAITTHGDFFGSAGAGCLPWCTSTGRLLVSFRSQFVNEPHTWGVWGGAMRSGENPKQVALREFREETGYRGEVTLEQVFEFKKGDFVYTTFLAAVPEEFEPVLDWENEDFKWVLPGEWPSPLHYGLEAAKSAIEEALS
jgi:8-oxo-dGTP pyrophosphatase MutT (NUDIX family)